MGNSETGIVSKELLSRKLSEASSRIHEVIQNHDVIITPDLATNQIYVNITDIQSLRYREIEEIFYTIFTNTEEFKINLQGINIIVIIFEDSNFPFSISTNDLVDRRVIQKRFKRIRSIRGK